MKAPLIEVFHSVQGEGRFVGQAMAFLRVATCPIRCLYCDTPHSYVASAEFPVQLGAGRRLERNPVSAGRAAELVRAVRAASPWGGPEVLSVTGGEPLVFAGFVAALGGELRPAGWRLHLETAALDPAAMAACAGVVAHLSADWKLPATLADGSDHGERHLGCIDAALAAGASVDVKMVLTGACGPDAIAAALRRLQPFRHRLLLVLQPVTPCGAVTAPVAGTALAAAARQAGELGFDCRVIPQTHKILGVP